MNSILSTLKKYHWVFTVISLGLFFMMIGNLYAEGAPSIIDWNPDPVTQGDQVTFSATEDYASYKWWISDGPGHPCEWQFDTEDSTDSTFTYTFYQSGDWEICLQVPDENEPGDNYTDIQTVTVDNHYPQIEDPLWWTATPEPSYVGQSFHVEVPFRDYEDISAYYCTIDYGDGTGAVAGTIQHIWEFEWLCIGPAHIYTTADDFIFVTATIYDDYPDLNSFSTSDIYYHEVIAPAVSLIVNAADDVVDGSGCDETHCSLREAVAAAASGDTITFAESLSGVTIFLEPGAQLTIDKNMTIDASALENRVTVTTDTMGRVFQVNNGVTATLNSLRIKHGNVTGNGGGIYNQGILTVDNVVLLNNLSSQYGGGIYNIGTLSVVNSSLILNSATAGGGIYNNGGTVSVTISSFDENSASAEGGGIYNAGSGSVHVNYSTFSDNSGSSGGGIANEQNATTTVKGSTLTGNIAMGNFGLGGGILNKPGATMSVVNSTFNLNTANLRGNAITNFGTLDLLNSTLSGNSGSSYTLVNIETTAQLNFANTIIANTTGGGKDCVNLNNATIGLNANNLVMTTSSATSEKCEASITSDPLLGPLMDNSGPTHTMALLAGSPAIDAGNNGICSGELVGGVDQRGVSRPQPQGGTCDIGAYEYEGDDWVPLMVNALDDVVDGDGCNAAHCSLREAIQNANSGDTITFAESLSGATITLSSQLTINKDVNIDSSELPERVTISGNNETRVFFFESNVTAVLDHLIIVNGKASGDPDELFDNFGGGIFNAGGTVRLKNSTLSACAADQVGGAVFNNGEGTLTVIDSTFANNFAQNGGGLYNEGELTVSRSTLVGNRAEGISSGYNGGGIFNFGTATVANSTFTQNDAQAYGSSIHNIGTMTLYNSTFSGNAGDTVVNYGSAAELRVANTIIADFSEWNWGCYNYEGEIIEYKNNLIAAGNCGDTSDADPKLGPLADNGGPTQTMAVLQGSAAINAGDNAICSGPLVDRVDQRGVTRPKGAACEIGAYEYQGVEPQTLVVNSENDAVDGDCDETHCSLREAVMYAGPGFTIYFAESLSGGTIILSSELDLLSKDVTIDGSGLNEMVTISGNNANRVFYLFDDANLTLDSLIISDGKTENGYGGGIYNAGGGLAVKNCILKSNYASHGGGAIYNNGGTVEVSESIIEFNETTHLIGLGGGVYNDYSGILSVINSTLSGNSSGYGGGGIAGAETTTTTIIGSTLTGNTAKTVGGGLVSYGETVVVNSTFFNNTAKFGGAIYTDGGTLDLYNSTLAGNAADPNGGALEDFDGTWHVANTIIANSTSGSDCYTFGTKGTFTNNLVGDGTCSATFSGDPKLGDLADNGGPTMTIALLAGSPAINAGDNGICSGTLVGAFDQRGVSRPQPQGGTCDIGAYEYEGDEWVPLMVNALDDVVDGGGCNAAHCSLREAVNAAGSGDTITFAQNLSRETITLTSQLTLNKDVTIDGSALAERVTISGDKQYRVFLINAGRTVTLASLVITDGKPAEAFANGGGIENHGTLSISNSSLEGNSALVDGGGIYNVGTLSIMDTSFTDNHAPSGIGGAIYNIVGTATLTRCTLSGNTAHSGGAIASGLSGTVIVRDSTLSGNTAAWFGGGINGEPDSSTVVISSTLVNNTAQAGGGGISNSGTLSVANSTFTENTVINSSGRGNAILNNGGNLTLYNSTLAGNKGYITLAQANPDGIVATMHYANTIIANTDGSWDCVVWPGNLGTNINNWVGDGDTNCQATFQGDPNLGDLADNGGPTHTMALLEGSPAIDAGDDAICAGDLVDGVDQRGVLRPQGTHCDIGAFELDQSATTGSLKISKNFDPLTSGFDGKFTIGYDCGTAHTDTVQLGAGESTTISGIPTGTECTVTEQNLPDAPAGWSFGAPTFNPANGKVTIGATTVEVTVTNTISRDRGALQINKVFNPLTSGFDGTFTINYDCGTTYQGYVELSAGESETIYDIPTGTECTVTEPTLPTAPAGWSFGAPMYNPADGKVTIGATIAEVTVTNTISRDRGALQINKVFNPLTSGFDGTFTINYDCGTTYQGYVELSAGESETIYDIPTGTSCTVTELTMPPAPTGWSFGTATYSPIEGTVTISETIAEVTVTNTISRDRGALQINKVFNPLTSGFDGTFTINYDCGTTYQGYVELSVGESETIYDIPTGTECTVTEPTLPTAPAGWSFGAPMYNPADGKVTIGATIAEVTVTNTISRDRGALQINKVFNPLTSGFDGTFTINYDCGTTYQGYVELSAGESETIYDIPTGTSCTVTELTMPPAPTGWSFGTATYSPIEGTVTISETIAEVTVTNTISRDTGALQINKVFEPGDSGFEDDFTIHYNCGEGFIDTVALGADEFTTIDNIPTGTECSVTEPDLPDAPAGWSFGAPTFNPADGKVTIGGTPVQVTVTNTISRDTGSLKISKNFDPLTSGFDGKFTIGYDCGTTHTDTVELGAGESTTIGGIPTGTECTVTEPTLPTAPAGWSFGTPTFNPANGKVTIGATIVEVTVTNTISRDTGSLKISKIFDPLTSEYRGNFRIYYNCGTEIYGFVELEAGEDLTVMQIPTGTECTVTEPDLPEPPAGWNFGTPTFNPANGKVTIGATTIEVTVTNTISRDTGTHIIDLVAGWNLVSINVIPTSTATTDVLASIAGDYDLVYAWDATGYHSNAGHWMKYDPSMAPGLNTLKNLDETMGFWILMNKAAKLEVFGAYPIQTSINLYTAAGGWNLVGYPSSHASELPSALEDNGVEHYSLVYAYHAADTTKPWKKFDPSMLPVELNTLTNMTHGWGYWIYVTEDAVWQVDFIE